MSDTLPPETSSIDLGHRRATRPSPDHALRAAQTAPDAARDAQTLTYDGLLSRPGARLPQIERLSAQLEADVANAVLQAKSAIHALRARLDETRMGMTNKGSKPKLDRAHRHAGSTLSEADKAVENAEDRYRRAGGGGEALSYEGRAFIVPALRRWGLVPLAAALEYWLIATALSVATRAENAIEVLVLAAIALLAMIVIPHHVGHLWHLHRVDGGRKPIKRSVLLGTAWALVYVSLAWARVVAATHEVAGADSSTDTMGDGSQVASASVPNIVLAMFFAGLMGVISAVTFTITYSSAVVEEFGVRIARKKRDAARAAEAETASRVDTYDQAEVSLIREQRDTEDYWRWIVNEDLPTRANELGGTYQVELARVVDPDRAAALEVHDYVVDVPGRVPVLDIVPPETRPLVHPQASTAHTKGDQR